MASIVCIRTILGLIQRNYNKVPAWAEESRIDWFQALNKYDDSEVEEAVRSIVRTRKKLPNVAAVIEFIQANRKGKEAIALEGCGACRSTGWREVAHWYSSRGKLQVTTFLAACDCPKGSRFAVKCWRDVVDKMRADPFTEAVYYGTHEQPNLTQEQRLHPEIMEKVRERNQAATTGAWQSLVDVPSNPRGGE
tara:strand:+ start:339 stop:917 length:579 start_codon:yes stop_codon:yes gene_type:complete